MNKLPEELRAARPGLSDDPTAQHPATVPYAGSAPLRYTAGLHHRIVELIERGNRPHVAAAMAGLPSKQFFAWMSEGRQDNGHPSLVQFAEDVEKASAVAEGKAVGTLLLETADEKLSAENVKWWLERSRADGYSKEANAKANAMIAEFLGRLEAGLTPAEFQKVIAVASGQVASVEKQVFRLRPASPDEE